MGVLRKESQKEEVAGWGIHAADTNEEGAHESGRTTTEALFWVGQGPYWSKTWGINSKSDYTTVAFYER